MRQMVRRARGLPRTSALVAGLCVIVGLAGTLPARAQTLTALPSGVSPAVQRLTQVIHGAVVPGYLARFVSTFAGQYIGGDGTNPTWVVRFTSDVYQRRDELVHLIPAGISLEVSLAQNSWQALTELSSRLRDDQEALTRRGVNVITVGPDAASNAVVVGVAAPSPAVVEKLTERYPGAPITVVRSSPPLAVDKGAGTGTWTLIAAGSAVVLVLLVGALALHRGWRRHMHAVARHEPLRR